MLPSFPNVVLKVLKQPPISLNILQKFENESTSLHGGTYNDIIYKQVQAEGPNYHSLLQYTSLDIDELLKNPTWEHHVNDWESKPMKIYK